MKEIIGVEISFEVPERIADQAAAIMATLYSQYATQDDVPTVFLEMAATLALLTSPVKADRETGKANVRRWKYGRDQH